MRKLIILLCFTFVGCNYNTSNNTAAIGYLGFKDHQPWAIQFNDCTVYAREEAIKYAWFDRQLKSISCYTFDEEDNRLLQGHLDKVYEAPDTDSNYKTFTVFSELHVSDAGWGTFPLVYSRKNNWLKVKEGWIYLTSNDLNRVQFYQGQQDDSLKQAHNDYYKEH